MIRTEKPDWEECVRLFIKTVMGNSLPMLWLFVCQPVLDIQFDGVGFWSIYAIFSIIVTVGMWYVNRTMPDPTYATTSEIRTPYFATIASTFQPIVFLCTLGLYNVVR